MSILLENDFSSIMDNQGMVKKKVSTRHIVSQLINNTIDECGGPSASLILPDNCRGVLYYKSIKTYFLEFPPQFHNIKLDYSLKDRNRRMYAEFRELYPDDTPRRIKTKFSLLFPYVIFAISIKDDRQDTYMFLKNTPLTSFNDNVYISPLPNTYEDGKICMVRDINAENSNDLNRICSLLVSDYWATTYNNDLGIRNPGEYKQIHNNYYLWEYKSLKNPESVLTSGFGPTTTLNFAKRKTSPNITKDVVSQVMGTFTEGYKFSESFDRQYLNYYRNASIYYIEISSEKLNKTVKLGVMDELDIDDTIYIITNFRTKSSIRSSSFDICEVEVAKKDDPTITSIYSKEVLQDAYSYSIVRHSLEKSKTIQNNITINDVEFSAGDSIIAINKHNKKVSFFNLDYVGRDIENIRYLKDNSSTGFYPENNYNFHLKKNLLTDKIIMDGILIEKNKSYHLFTKDSIQFKYNSEFKFTEDINFSNILNRRNRFNFEDFTCSLKTVENNIINASIVSSIYRPIDKIIVTDEEIENAIPVNFVLGARTYYFLENVFMVNKPSQWLIQKDGCENKISSSVSFYLSDLNILRKLEVNDTVILPKCLDDGNISSTYYTIKEIIVKGPQVSALIQNNSDTNDKQMVSLFNSETNSRHPSILRHAIYEFKKVKKGDYIRKTSKTKVCGFNKANIYQISAIITDSLHPDILLLLENGQTLYYDTFEEHFEVIVPNETPSSLPVVEYNGYVMYYDLTFDSDGNVIRSDDKFRYGIPYPLVFNYEDVEVRNIF